jgi:hypothetical protein
VERALELEMTEEGEGAVEESDGTVGDEERAVAAVRVGDASEDETFHASGALVGFGEGGVERGVVGCAEHERAVAGGLYDDGNVAAEEAAETGGEFVARGEDDRRGVFRDDDLSDGGGVGHAELLVSDRIVAQPETVAVVGAEGGGEQRESESEEESESEAAHGNGGGKNLSSFSRSVRNRSARGRTEKN